MDRKVKISIHNLIHFQTTCLAHILLSECETVVSLLEVDECVTRAAVAAAACPRAIADDDKRKAQSDRERVCGRMSTFHNDYWSWGDSY